MRFSFLILVLLDQVWVQAFCVCVCGGGDCGWFGLVLGGRVRVSFLGSFRGRGRFWLGPGT